MERPSCDICYKDLTDKVSLDCGHELCVICFLEIIRTMSTSSVFKCQMCRKEHKWKKEEHKEETLSLLIREDESSQFKTLVGMEASKVFEVIINEQNIIQFIVVLHNQLDTETLKFLISEFVANNAPFPFFEQEELIQSLRSPVAFSHFKNTGSHLEAFYNNPVIKKYEE